MENNGPLVYAYSDPDASNSRDEVQWPMNHQVLAAPYSLSAGQVANYRIEPPPYNRPRQSLTAEQIHGKDVVVTTTGVIKYFGPERAWSHDRILKQNPRALAQLGWAVPENNDASTASRAQPVYPSPSTPNSLEHPYQEQVAPESKAVGSDSISTLPQQSYSSSLYRYPSSQAAHNRSDSTSTSTSASTSNPRSASPALSVASAITSISSSTSAPGPHLQFADIQQPPSISITRKKHRKQRLFNVDRRAICVFHEEHPEARQEDIAAQYGVERSTISKILKDKHKWLNVPADEDLRICKRRPTKFPEIEIDMCNWLEDCKNNNIQMTDALIRSTAKEFALYRNYSEEKFKASSGWVENFKHRHGIRRGIWEGDGRGAKVAKALGLASVPKPVMDKVLLERRNRAAAASSSNANGESADFEMEPEDSPEPEYQSRPRYRLPVLDIANITSPMLLDEFGAPGVSQEGPSDSQNRSEHHAPSPSEAQRAMETVMRFIDEQENNFVGVVQRYHIDMLREAIMKKVNEPPYNGL